MVTKAKRYCCLSWLNALPEAILQLSPSSSCRLCQAVLHSMARRGASDSGSSPHSCFRFMSDDSSGADRDATKPVLSFKTGDVSESYEVGKKLGEGHFGATFRCQHKKTGKEYAMKRLSKRRLLMLGAPLEDVKQEVGMLYHLAGHPNVISIADAFEDSLHVSIVMELCTGGELYDRLVERGSYSEHDAARLVKTIVSVVEYCHAMGVVHRDLKPENFLFASRAADAPLKVIDFGLSVFFTPGEPISAGLAGSPLYLAPEMVASNGERYGPEVDVWSAGVIMYMLLSGYCPFPTDLPSMSDLLSAILYDVIDYEASPWGTISSEAKELVQGMLTRAPEHRLTAAQVLQHPWIAKAGVAPETPIDPTVASRLRHFFQLTHIRKLATRVVARHLTEEQILGMREIFCQMDVDHSGSISLAELRRGLRRFGESLCDSELEGLFSAIDANESKSIDMEEFFAATLGLHRLTSLENLHSAFEHLDTDGSGFITLEELQRACGEYGMDAANVKEMMAEADTNHDNRIDYTEFVAMMRLQGVPKPSTSHSLGKDRSVLKKVSSQLASMKRSPTV